MANIAWIAATGMLETDVVPATGRHVVEGVVTRVIGAAAVHVVRRAGFAARMAAAPNMCPLAVPVRGNPRALAASIRGSVAEGRLRAATNAVLLEWSAAGKPGRNPCSA